MAGRRKLTDEQVRRLRVERNVQGAKLEALAHRYRVSRFHVSLIAAGHRRRGAGGPIVNKSQQAMSDGTS